MKRTIASATAVGAVLIGALSTFAAEPTPRPIPTVGTRGEPVEWPCLAEGWTAGDRWGPGPLDIVPDVPPCEKEEGTGIDWTDVPSVTLPPTDTE
jgi:hypothetical protein